MSIAISVNQLIKSYGSNNVIRGISFEVNKGETFALLGTNGAGKTTTLECIEGLKKYDSGEIAVNGRIGVQLQSTSLPQNIKVTEAFKLFCKWNNVSSYLELQNTFGLTEIKNKQYKEMSTGQKRRLHLALALINNPDIIFLDEPTAGLDVEGRAALHEEIKSLKQKGKTFIIASHDMAEVESLCDRIAILKEGRIAFIGTSSELKNTIKTESKIFIKTIKPFGEQSFKCCSYEGVGQEYSVYKTNNVGDALLELLQEAKNKQNMVIDVRIEQVTLEQRFLDIAKEGK